MTGSPTGTGSLAWAVAAEASRLVESDPAAVGAVAAHAISLARASTEPGAEIEARLALAVAARLESRLAEAVEQLRRAERLARRHQLDGLRFRVHTAQVSVLAQRGDFRQAKRVLAESEPLARGADRAILLFNTGYILQAEGLLPEALQAYEPALTLLRRSGDTSRQARLLNNRAMIHAQRGFLDSALTDLRQAERLYLSVGQDRWAADVWANIGWTLAHRGDLVEALRWFDRADAYFDARGEVDPLSLKDRVDALLAARLIPEARQYAERAETEFLRRGAIRRLAETRLQLSHLSLLDGDVEAAKRYADQAARSFRRQGQPTLSALARFAKTRIEFAEGVASSAMLRRARDLARALSSTGWMLQSIDARLLAARIALLLGRTKIARSELSAVVAGSRSAPPEIRSRVCYAQALLHLAEGAPVRAESRLRAGMALLERHRAALGATELRALVSTHSADLARLGIEMALGQADAAQVLTWAERARANALWLRPVRFARDPEVAAELAALREISGQIEAGLMAGRDIRRLLARQAEAESRVRRRSLVSSVGGVVPDSRKGLDWRELVETLGDRVLVEIVPNGDQLLGIALAGDRVRPLRSPRRPVLHDLGRTDAALAEVSSLRFALRRLSLGHGSEASLRAAAELASLAARRLERQLLSGVLPEDRNVPVVLIPTGALHAVPWHTLSTCARRAVSVSPSAALWLRGAQAPGWAAPVDAGSSPGGHETVLVSGPGLPGAQDEVRGIAELYPAAILLEGARATVPEVLAALEGAASAHIAAHGSVRADNPHFSSLKLADGPLSVYDVEGLNRAPRLLVLSACDAGLSDVKPGDELRGLTAALLSMDAAAVIASVVPVPDDAARPLMLALHRGLLAGLSPAAALAQAQPDPSVDAGSGVTAGFVCFGSG